MTPSDTNALPARPAKLYDPDRLAALQETELLDSESEASFDRLTRLASRILHAPVTLVSLVDAHRQFFKSHVGLPEPWATRRETPLSHSFCKHVVASGEPLIIPDALEDERVAGNGAITEIGVRAYAGIPLATSEGEVLGSFCAIDTRPRLWSDEEIEILAELADSVMTEIELRRSERAGRRALAACQRAESDLQGTMRKLGFAYAREKRIAVSLQESLLVFPPQGCFPELDVEVLYQPSLDEAEVGGDFFDAFSLSGGQIVLIVGDASGKGLAAAVRTAEAKYALRAYMWDRENVDLPGTLARLNRFLSRASENDKGISDGFISLSLAVVDPATGEAQVARAGAEPPILLRGDSNAASELLSPDGPVLGAAATGEFEILRRRLAPGDTLLLHTDGLTEARRGRMEFLGCEGLADLARRAAGAFPSPLKRMADSIVEDARAFARGALGDDVCLLLARRASPNRSEGC